MDADTEGIDGQSENIRGVSVSNWTKQEEQGCHLQTCVAKI